MPSKNTWAFVGEKKMDATESSKRLVKERSDEFLDSTLKEKMIAEQEEFGRDFRIVDLFTKWRGDFLYFKARLEWKHPDAIPPIFEEGFARLEYVDEDSYNLSYLRHTGKWWEVHRDLTLEQCLYKISKERTFRP